MPLNSDAQGFLIGTPVELSGFREEMAGILNDVRAIRRTLVARRDRPIDSRPVVTPSSRRPSREFDPAPVVAVGSGQHIATPSGRGSARVSQTVATTGELQRGNIGMPGRVAVAAAEAAKGVVNEESDASVKAFSEIAEPLKRGWAAIRGGNAAERQEGWLKRILKAVTGWKRPAWPERGGNHRSEEAGEPSGFERARERVAMRDGGRREGADSQNRITGGDPVRNDTALARREGGVMSWLLGSAANVSTAPAMTLQSIEAHLRSLDKKVKAPKGDGIFIHVLPIFTTFIPSVIEWLRDRRMDSNLERIEGHTRRQLEISHPFFVFTRRRLIAIGEAIEEAGHENSSPGFFSSLLAPLLAPLLSALAGLATRLAGVPLIGPALAGLTRMLGGARVAKAVPAVAGAGKAAGAAANASAGGAATPAVAGVAGGAAAARWGKAAQGLRANRVLRTGRVFVRNAGRAIRPLGRVLTKVPVVGSLLALGLGVAGSASIEKDETLSRDQKNAAQGKNWGGVAGSLGGAALGAALGTAIAPGIGTVIGGVLGAVVGDWLGGNLGELIGSKFSAFMAPLAPVFSEIKVWALATWDWIRDSASAFFDGAKAVFSGVGKWITERWTAFVDTVTGVFDTFVSNLKTVLNALKNVPVLGDAIRAAERAANAVADAATATAQRTKEAAGAAVEGAKDMAGRAWDGAVEYANARVPKGIRDRVAHERALQTAADYKQGNISGLDDAHTRELVASTALTESAGGKLGVVNSAGYLGRYQAGASWLADAGLIRGGSEAVKAAMKRDGFANEYKWGASGGMTRFLNNNTNWNNGLSRAQYLASADIQDKAFRTNSNLAYQQLVNDGTITKSHTQAQIAGLLKARHIAGIGGARAVAAGRTGRKDANGTSARDYYNDLAGRDAQFSGVFTVGASAAIRAPAAPVVATTKAPVPPPPPVAPAIPDAPKVQVPLGSAPAAKPISVQMPNPDAGQDVRDRGIAHIATGGLARA